MPRLRAHFQLDDPDIPAVVREALVAVQTAINAFFDSLGFNLYRDHRDSVAPHNVKLVDLQHGQPIALLSLSATRRMTIRAKQPPRRVLHVKLEPEAGSGKRAAGSGQRAAGSGKRAAHELGNETPL